MKKFINSKFGTITAILGASGLSLFIYLLNRWPKSKPELRSKSVSLKSIRELHGGYRAWNRLATDQYKAPPSSDSATVLTNELQKELPDLIILQENVENLENEEREGVAEKILGEALKNASNKPHEAYDIEMLLVEVLIYRGEKEDLEKALKYKCLGDESLRDARRPLFKAIIYQMTGNIEKAKQNLHEFMEVRCPPSQDEIDFEQFKSHVRRLQEANARQK